MARLPAIAANPALAAQWHPLLNGTATPETVTQGSSRPVWWKCPVNPSHVWRARPADRRRGNGCPRCVGRFDTPFITVHPGLEAEWHPTLNSGLQMVLLTVGSQMQVWWQCVTDPSHAPWSARVPDRIAGKGCPTCAGKFSRPLNLTHPELITQWHPDMNGALTPDQVTAGSALKVWWQCPAVASHQWPAAVKRRAGQNDGCPWCAGKIAAPLSVTHPAVAADWHPTLNGDLTPGQVTHGRRGAIWWLCPARNPDHPPYRALMSDRVRGQGGCPRCAGKFDQPLSVTHPAVAADWHPTLNGDLTPDQVTAGVHTKVWWRCPDEPVHAPWKASVAHRSHGRGCKACGYRKARAARGFRSLPEVHPELAAQWHPVLNTAQHLAAADVAPSSTVPVWWQCPVDPTHVWQNSTIKRVRNPACPLCPAPRSCAGVR